MEGALDNFSAVLEQAMVHLQKSMQQENTFTALVLAANGAHVAATLLAHWQRHAPAQAQLHLVFFEAAAIASSETKVTTEGAMASTSAARTPLAANSDDACAALDGLLAASDDAGVLLPGVHRFDAPAHRLTVTRLIGPVSQTFSQLVAVVDLVLVDSTRRLAEIAHYADSVLRIAAADLAVVAPQPVLEQLQQAIRNKGSRALALHPLSQPWQVLLARLHKPAKPLVAPARTAWVVGGSLAGAGVAYALALRGWHVHVTDPALAHDQSGPQAGHLAAALTPLISIDDNFKARLSRAGVYRAHQRWADFDADIIVSRSGTLELARSKGHARDLLQAVQAMTYPEGWVSLTAPPQAATRAGVGVTRHGAYFVKGMTVSPPNLIRKLLSHPNIVCHGVQIDSLQKGAQGWQLRSHQNKESVVVAECDTVILAAAAHTPALLAQSGLDHHTLRSGRRQPTIPAIMSMDTLAGQVMHVPAAMLPQVPVSVIGAEGYFLPAVQGQCVLGSTYEREPVRQGCTRRGQQQIVSKLAPALAPAVLQPVVDAMAAHAPIAGLSPLASSGEAGDESSGDGGNALPAHAQAAQHDDAPVFAGWAGSRAVIRGRLPAFGPMRHAPGLWLACGYASHGLTWSALAGDVIAAMLNAEPVPLERDLLQAVAPR
ncbi:MAG: FAD-dependent oxidoreductase [Advenella sp.]|uniref:FAD-dependent oxidoreductase n=1 Tax=Advenella sp. TaxID=1872388 RepID=UPI003F974BA1